MVEAEYSQVLLDVNVANKFRLLVLQLFKTPYNNTREQATFAIDQHCKVLQKIIKQREIDGESDLPPPTERELLIFMFGDEVPENPPNDPDDEGKKENNPGGQDSTEV